MIPSKNHKIVHLCLFKASASSVEICQHFTWAQKLLRCKLCHYSCHNCWHRLLSDSVSAKLCSLIWPYSTFDCLWTNVFEFFMKNECNPDVIMPPYSPRAQTPNCMKLRHYVCLWITRWHNLIRFEAWALRLATLQWY